MLCKDLKNVSGITIGIALYRYSSFGSVNILNAAILPAHDRCCLLKQNEVVCVQVVR